MDKSVIFILPFLSFFKAFRQVLDFLFNVLDLLTYSIRFDSYFQVAFLIIKFSHFSIIRFYSVIQLAQFTFTFFQMLLTKFYCLNALSTMSSGVKRVYP